uniref:Guanidinoacetate N-methyltransferase n=1 Tax=Zooxanthella nutricula TaxID=1333877 RepID=A0A7S2VNS4_9DINO
MDEGPGGQCSKDVDDVAALRDAWQAAPAVYCDLPGGCEGLRILGEPVMEAWEAPYMAALAAVACGEGLDELGGRVLEVGFGLGISAANIDAYDAVQEHVIVEANEEVLGRAAVWADDARRPTTVIGGFWEDVVGDLPDASFGAILFDVFPLSAAQAAGDGEAGPFFAHAARLLRPGGRFAFYYDAGRNWIECVRAFRGETTSKLLAAGFASVEEDQVQCTPRRGCTYFWKDRFLVPLARR